jgi:hypothetical protein
MSPRRLEGDPCDPHFFELNEECGTRYEQISDAAVPIAMGFCQILMLVHRKSIIMCMQRVLSPPPFVVVTVQRFVQA